MSIIELLPYILAVEACIAGVAGFALLWHFKIRIVYRAEFYRVLQSSAFGGKQYLKVGQKDFKPDAEFVRYRKKSYTVLANKKVSTDGRKHVWAFDVDTNQGITFGGTHDVGDPSFTDDLLFSGVLKEFARRVGSFDAMTWLIITLMIVVAVLAFVSGLFASPYILPPTNATVPIPAGV